MMMTGMMGETKLTLATQWPAHVTGRNIFDNISSFTYLICFIIYIWTYFILYILNHFIIYIRSNYIGSDRWPMKGVRLKMERHIHEKIA